MLQKECCGILFIKTQRKLNFYLRALWGRDFFLRPTGADFVDFRPFISNVQIKVLFAFRAHQIVYLKITYQFT